MQWGDEAGLMRKAVLERVMAHDYAMQFHGFYVDVAEKRMSFDVVLSFDCDRQTATEEIVQEIRTLYPGFEVQVQADVDVSG
jgi:hypothetical protein